MADIVDSIETGERCTIEIPGLACPLRLPYVWLPGEEQDTRIAQAAGPAARPRRPPGDIACYSH